MQLITGLTAMFCLCILGSAFVKGGEGLHKSPNYKVSKFITKILKEKINLNNKFTVKNSLELANKLKEIKITDEKKNGLI